MCCFIWSPASNGCDPKSDHFEHLLAALRLPHGEIWAKLVPATIKTATIRLTVEYDDVFLSISAPARERRVPRRGGRIDLKCFVPMFRVPELGRGAHDSRQTRQFNFIET
jgi:hypothetical protein